MILRFRHRGQDLLFFEDSILGADSALAIAPLSPLSRHAAA